MNKAAFFDAVRDRLYKGSMSPSQVAGCEAILEACAGWPVNWTAYAFATAYHETAFTMKPLREFGTDAYLTRMYDVTGKDPARAKKMGNTTPGDGVRYCGRGYVQLTWKNNYRKLGILLDRDLVRTPDMAMQPEIAALIMRYGMQDGLFTGKKLSDYLTASKSDYVNARKVINGTDKAKTIAGYALVFEDALKAAGKPVAKPKPVEAPPVVSPPVIKQPDDPGTPEPTIKNTPVSPKSRTAQGTVASGAGGALVIADAAETLTKADGHISNGTWLQIAIGVLIIAGAAYAFYARWQDGGGRFPWQKGDA